MRAGVFELDRGGNDEIPDCLRDGQVQVMTELRLMPEPVAAG